VRVLEVLKDQVNFEAITLEVVCKACSIGRRIPAVSSPILGEVEPDNLVAPAGKQLEIR